MQKTEDSERELREHVGDELRLQPVDSSEHPCLFSVGDHEFQVSVEVARRIAVQLLTQAELHVCGGRDKEGYFVTTDIAQVPQERGSFAVYDGLELRGGGCARNMRTSAWGMGWLGDTMRIYRWKWDSDGSVWNWLENSIDKPCPEMANGPVEMRPLNGVRK